MFFHISAVQSDQPAAADGPPESSATSEETLAAAQAEGGVQTDAGQPGSAAEQGDEAQGPKQQGEKGKKRDLSELLQPGDAVEFVVAASSQEGVRQHKGSRPPKMMGKEVSSAFNTPALHQGHTVRQPAFKKGDIAPTELQPGVLIKRGNLLRCSAICIKLYLMHVAAQTSEHAHAPAKACLLSAMT